MDAPPDALRLISDARVSELDALAIEELAAIQRTGEGSFRDARERLGPMLRRHRTMMNTDAGYWILAPGRPDALKQALRGTIDVPDSWSLVIATDGFARIVDTFDFLAGWGSLLNELERVGPQPLVDRLRAAESADPEARRYPRLSIHDDASLIFAMRARRTSA